MNDAPLNVFDSPSVYCHAFRTVVTESVTPPPMNVTSFMDCLKIICFYNL
jgi:hypothetical protein